MKSIRIIVAFAAFALALIADQPLTNDNVIRMVQSGVPTDLVLKTIWNAESFQFGLLPGDLIALGQAKVPEEVIRAMAARINNANAPVPNPPAVKAPSPVPPASASQPSSRIQAAALVEPSGPVGGRAKSEDESYGSHLGSVLFGGSGGIVHVAGVSGVYTNVGGELSVGLHRYLGLFAAGGYSPIAHGTYCDYFACAEASAHLAYFSGGVEVVGSNRSRVVPFGRIGFGYGEGVASASSEGVKVSLSQGVPAVTFGGGVRAYLNRHFGFSGGFQAYRTLGSYGGNTFMMPVGGVFGEFR